MSETEDAAPCHHHIDLYADPSQVVSPRVVWTRWGDVVRRDRVTVGAPVRCGWGTSTWGARVLAVKGQNFDDDVLLEPDASADPVSCRCPEALLELRQRAREALTAVPAALRLGLPLDVILSSPLWTAVCSEVGARASLALADAPAEILRRAVQRTFPPAGGPSG